MKACAKINLALVVGPRRPDGKHEVLTVLQQVDLHDDVVLERGDGLHVEGFVEDTLVRDALRALASAAGVAPSWSARIEKRIPVAAGLGGGSADAAAALVLANDLLARPLPTAELGRVAARLGADVPFFLHGGAQLGSGDGSELAPLDLPCDYVALLALAEGATKSSTQAVYRAFDERDGATGFEARRTALLRALEGVREPRDLGLLPRNDLASSPLSSELEDRGALRSDVSGAGPVVYGLFEQAEDAERAAAALRGRARTWLVRPVPAG